MRILLMEDEVHLGLEMAQALQKEGHEVVIARSGDQARDELWHWDFDLLITDIVVKRDGRPVADGGFGLISWVRHHATVTPGLKYLPIIAISGSQIQRGLDFVLPTAQRIGADVVMEKPVNYVDLIANINRLGSEPPKS